MDKKRVKIDIAIDERHFVRAEKLAAQRGIPVERLLEEAVKDVLLREHNEAE